MLYLGILLVALRPLLASAIAWDAPAHTISELFPEQFSAVETAAPELLKRDVPPSSVCGYFPADNSFVTCASTNYCGFNTAQSAFGCCGTYTYGIDSIYTLLDCFEPTTCYETSPIGATDTSALYCSRATASKCMSFELSIPGQVYYALGCSNVHGLFQIQPTPVAQTTGAPTAIVSTSGTPEGIGNPISQSSSLSGNGNGNGIGSGGVVSSLIPPTQTQKTAGSVSTIKGVSPSSSRAAAGGLVAPGWGVNIAIGVLGVLL